MHVASRLGLLTNNNLPDLPIHRLNWLQVEYPPQNHFILEHLDLPVPPIQKVVDPTCNTCTNYHKLDESWLQFTLPANESGIFVDNESDEIIAVVLRDFAKDYVSLIQEWGEAVIRDSLA